VQSEFAKIEDSLWNSAVNEALYEGTGEKYQAAILEQYKIYAEMADRIGQRRGLTNTFFLTLNTAIFTVIGVFWEHKPEGRPWWLVFLLAMLLGECFAWYYLLRSYRQLNTAKYQVIGALETRLPASPYWSAEWKALGEGKDRKKYWPLSHIESLIPIFFAALFVGGFAALMAMQTGSKFLGD
jgi:MFS family permease